MPVVSNVTNNHVTEGKMLMKGAAIRIFPQVPSPYTCLIDLCVENKENIKLTWALKLLSTEQEGDKEASNRLKHSKATLTESKPWEEIHTSINEMCMKKVIA